MSLDRADKVLGPEYIDPRSFNEDPGPSSFTLVDHQSDGSHQFGTEFSIPVVVMTVHGGGPNGTTGTSDTPAREDHVHGFLATGLVRVLGVAERGVTNVTLQGEENHLYLVESFMNNRATRLPLRFTDTRVFSAVHDIEFVIVYDLGEIGEING